MSMLIIIGIGGHSRVVARIAKETNKWNKIIFIDEKTNSLSEGTTNDCKKFINEDFFVAIGNIKKRKEIFNLLKKDSFILPAIISKNSLVYSDKIGNGSIVMDGVFINNDVTIGESVVINNYSLIEHDCYISNFVNISPKVSIAGSTKIGEETFIGLNSTLSNNLNITSHVIVGASSVVTHSVSSPGTYVGQPIRKVYKPLNDLIIVGAGGFGNSIYWTAKNNGNWKNVYFLDDHLTSKDNELVIGNFQDRKKYRYDDFIVGIGDNEIRKKFIEKLLIEKFKVVNLISKLSNITNSKVGLGSIILNQVFLNANCSLGKGVIVNNNVYIGHDCTIDDYSQISPKVSIAGNVRIGQSTSVGMASTIIENLKINGNVIIGAASLVLKDLNEPGTYVGSPVKKIK